MLGLAERHQRGQKLIEEDRLTGDQVDMHGWQENGGECEEILVSNQQFNFDNELIACFRLALFWT